MNICSCRHSYNLSCHHQLLLHEGLIVPQLYFSSLEVKYHLLPSRHGRDKIRALNSIHRLRVPFYQYLAEKKKKILLGIELLLLIPWDLYHILRWVLAVATNVHLSVQKSPQAQWDSGFLLSAGWCFKSCRMFFHHFSTWCFSLRKVILDSESQAFCSFIWADVPRPYTSRYLGNSSCQFVSIAADAGSSGSTHPTFLDKASFCTGNSVSDWHHCLHIDNKFYPVWDVPGSQSLSWPLRSMASNSELKLL